MHLDHVLGAGGAVEAVDVLRDHALEQAAPLELGQRLVGARSAACRRASGSAAGSRTRSAPGRARRRRCGRPPSGRRSPRARSPACGSRESRRGPRPPPRSARPCSSTRRSARRALDRAGSSRLFGPLSRRDHSRAVTSGFRRMGGRSVRVLGLTVVASRPVSVTRSLATGLVARASERRVERGSGRPSACRLDRELAAAVAGCSANRRGGGSAGPLARDSAASALPATIGGGRTR